MIALKHEIFLVYLYGLAPAALIAFIIFGYLIEDMYDFKDMAVATLLSLLFSALWPLAAPTTTGIFLRKKKIQRDRGEK